MYWDLFDMKKRELDEFTEVCAKEAEQKKESEQESKYVYNGEYQSAIKRIAAYLTGDSSEDPEYSSMEIIAKKLLDRVEGGSTEALPLRVHEGVPVYAWGENYFDIFGTLHIHDRDDISLYSTFSSKGYDWNLVGTASGTTPVTFDSSNCSEIMLVSKYYENANNNWIATAIIPVAELVAEGLVVMMPARIYSSTQNDKGCLVRITTTSANVDEWYSNRTSVKTSATLAVYMR